MRPRLIPGLPAAAVALTACGADSAMTGDRSATVYDSAGATVVVNPPTGLWTPATAWRLEEELRIGAGDGDSVRQFGNVAGIALDASGHIHVLDRQAAEVRVFDTDGAFLRSFGRPGGGPGELASPSALLLGAGDTIFLPDARNQRVQRFLVDGSEAGSFPVSPADGIPLEWRIRPDGLLLEEVMTLPAARAGVDQRRRLVLVRSGDGEIRDTVLEMPIGEAMEIRNGQPRMTVFAPEPMWTRLTDGRLAAGWNGQYRLEIRSLDGRVERIVHKPFERRPFEAADQRALRELLREHFEDNAPSQGTARMLQSLSYADQYPVFASLFGGPDGTLWVQHARTVPELGLEDMAAFNVRAIGASTWDVFDRDGQLLGTLGTPKGFQPMLAQGDYLYGVQPDELGVQYVVRLRVVR